LTVHNTLGQEVAQLVNARQGAGSYTFAWDGIGFASGTYYLQLTANSQPLVRKMLLVK